MAIRHGVAWAGCFTAKFIHLFFCLSPSLHGTRFETLAILVKALKCVSGELETDV